MDCCVTIFLKSSSHLQAMPSGPKRCSSMNFMMPLAAMSMVTMSPNFPMMTMPVKKKNNDQKTWQEVKWNCKGPASITCSWLSTWWCSFRHSHTGGWRDSGSGRKIQMGITSIFVRLWGGTFIYKAGPHHWPFLFVVSLFGYISHTMFLSIRRNQVSYSRT